MTTNLFITANVKQWRTQVVLEFYCLFSEHLEGVGVLKSAIFNSFHNRVEFVTILEGLRNFVGGGFEHPKIPPRYATDSTYSKQCLWWFSTVVHLTWNKSLLSTSIVIYFCLIALSLDTSVLVSSSIKPLPAKKIKSKNCCHVFRLPLKPPIYFCRARVCTKPLTVVVGRTTPKASNSSSVLSS